MSQMKWKNQSHSSSESHEIEESHTLVEIIYGKIILIITKSSENPGSDNIIAEMLKYGENILE